MVEPNYETIQFQGKPFNPGRRFLALEGRKGLNVDVLGNKVKAPANLTRCLPSNGGRNNLGRVTVRFSGGRCKRKYRNIDFKRDKDDVPARVHSIHYDPFRSARIALLFYADGEKRFILSPKGLQIGDVVLSGDKKVPYRLGCCLPLGNIPLGIVVHNVELAPGRGGVFVRAAGQGAQIVSKDGRYVRLKLPSKEVRVVLATCRASIGSVSNQPHVLRSEGKAGRSRWQGKRGHVKGIAMNPHDHPRGGGEGKHSGHLAYSFSGVESKGHRTRKKKKQSSVFIARTRRGKVNKFAK